MQTLHRAQRLPLRTSLFISLCTSLFISLCTCAAAQSAGIPRIIPAIDACRIAWPCSIPFFSASLEFVSEFQSSAPQHSGSSWLSADKCCTGSESLCEWTVSPLLSNTLYRVTLVILGLPASDADGSDYEPSIYHLTAHTLSPSAALPPSLSFTCDGLLLSWSAASPASSSLPLLLQRLVAIRSSPDTRHNTTTNLLDVPASLNYTQLPLPLPSGESVQFAVISYFGANRDGVVSNSSSLPSQSVNLLNLSNYDFPPATAAGMQAFADSNSVTVVFKSFPAMSFVVLLPVAESLVVGCNRSSISSSISSSSSIGSSSSIDTGSTRSAGCAACGFQIASSTVTFGPLSAATDWSVVLCVPASPPPLPCSRSSTSLAAAAIVRVRTAGTPQPIAPDITEATATKDGMYICWRSSFGAASSWSLTVRFNATSNFTVSKPPAELTASASAPGSICCDVPLSIGSVCESQNSSNAVIAVTQLASSSADPVYLPSSDFPLFSLCPPPPPQLSACIAPNDSDSSSTVVNVTWPPQPKLTTRLILTVYDVDDSGNTATIHNVSVADWPNFLALPLPPGTSCCLTARSSTLSNALSEFTTPICGLQAPNNQSASGVIISRSGLNVSVYFTPPLVSTSEAFLQSRCALRIFYGASADQCHQDATVPSLTASPAIPLDFDFARFFIVSNLTNSSNATASNATVALSQTEPLNVFASLSNTCIRPSSFSIIASLPPTIARMPCIRASVACGQWVASQFSPPDIDAASSWRVTTTVSSIDESGALVMFVFKKRNASESSLPFPFTAVTISTSLSVSDTIFQLTQNSSIRRDSVFASFKVPLVLCSGNVSFGFTAQCGTGCVVSNISSQQVRAFCPPVHPPVFVSLVGDSTVSLTSVGGSTVLSSTYVYTLSLALPSMCGSLLVNLENVNSTHTTNWSSGWVPCVSTIQIPVSLSYQSFQIVARASHRMGRMLSSWTSSATLAASLSHFSSKCDLFSNCKEDSAASSLSNVSIAGITSLGSFAVRVFLAAPSDSTLLLQIRCFCNTTTNNIKSTFIVLPGNREVDTSVPAACACVALVAPVVFATNPISRSCLTPPSVVPFDVSGSSTCLVVERSVAPCFSFISPPYAVSAIAIPSSNYAFASLRLQLQGIRPIPLANEPQRLATAEAGVYDSVFNAICDSCSCSSESGLPVTFDGVTILSASASFECSLSSINSDINMQPTITCPIAAFLENSSVAVILSLNGSFSRSPPIVSPMSPSAPIFVQPLSIVPSYSLASSTSYLLRDVPALNMRLRFQVYDGALPVRCFVNISSNSSSRVLPLDACASAEISSSMLHSASGGFVSIIAVNDLGSTSSLRVPITPSSTCSAYVRVGECSDDSIILQFNYLHCDSIYTQKLLLTSGACNEDISAASIVSVYDISSLPPSMTITSLPPSSTFCAVSFVNDVRGSLTPLSTAPAPLAFMRSVLYAGRARSSGADNTSLLLEWEYPSAAQGCSITAVVRAYCEWDSTWHQSGDPFVAPCLFQTMTVVVPSHWSKAEVEVRSAHASCRSSSQSINVTTNATSAVVPVSEPPLLALNSSDVSRPTATISWTLTKVLHASVINVQLNLIRLSCSIANNASCVSPTNIYTTIYNVRPSAASFKVDLDPSATYVARIILFNSFGPSAPSALSNVVSTLKPPPLPAVISSNSTFSLQWSDALFVGSVSVDVWNTSIWTPVISNAPILSSPIVVNSSSNSLYRLKVASSSNPPLESRWVGLHTLLPPATVSFERISSTSVRISWNALFATNSAEIGYIANLCTRRFNVSEMFTCARIAGSASGCYNGLSTPSSVDLVSSISSYDLAVVPPAPLIMCARNFSFLTLATNGTNETRSYIDMPLDIRNTVAYVQVAKVSWFGLLSAWSPPSPQISSPVAILPTASIITVRFGSSLVLGTPSIILQLNASDARLQLVRAAAIIAVPGDSACSAIDVAALGDTRCVQIRTVICNEDGNARACETLVHCDISRFLSPSCTSSGAIIQYSGISYSGSAAPSAYLPLSSLPGDASSIMVSVVTINSFATSSLSRTVSIALPCQPPSEVEVLPNINGADVSFVNTVPCSHVLRLWAINASNGVTLLRELIDPSSPTSLQLLPRGVGLAVTLSSIGSSGVEGLSSPPFAFVLPPYTPLNVRVEVRSQGEIFVAWSQPVATVLENVPYSGYAATPLVDVAVAFNSSNYGDSSNSQWVIAATLDAGRVVSSVSAVLSAGYVLLPPSLRSANFIYVARLSFGVRSEWVGVRMPDLSTPCQSAAATLHDEAYIVRGSVSAEALASSAQISFKLQLTRFSSTATSVPVSIQCYGSSRSAAVANFTRTTYTSDLWQPVLLSSTIVTFSGPSSCIGGLVVVSFPSQNITGVFSVKDSDVCVDSNIAAASPSITQAWCVLRTEGLAAGVGGVFVSSSGEGSVLVAATRCGVGSFGNASIDACDFFSCYRSSSVQSIPSLLLGDDGMGHASVVINSRSWPHPSLAAGRTVRALAPSGQSSSCRLIAVGSLPTAPVAFECSSCTTLAMPGDSLISLASSYGVHWTVLLALNTKMQPSQDILGKAVRVAHRFNPRSDPSALRSYLSSKGLRVIDSSSNATCVLPAPANSC